ncbi:hypothetical protein LSAT2_012976 [Lamellibrachia satsuma]|nr:hypothetical protein LSAT2_012976 [Lamellibrachia satsuma]
MIRLHPVLPGRRKPICPDPRPANGACSEAGRPGRPAVSSATAAARDPGRPNRAVGFNYPELISCVSRRR